MIGWLKGMKSEPVDLGFNLQLRIVTMFQFIFYAEIKYIAQKLYLLSKMMH